MMTINKKATTIRKHTIFIVLACVLIIPLIASSQTSNHDILASKNNEIKVLKKLIYEKHPEKNFTIFRLARLYDSAGYYDYALDYYKKSLKSNLFSDKSLFGCANIYLKRGDQYQALAFADRITDVNLTELFSARLLYYRADYGNAKKLLNNIIARKPHLPSAWYEMAKILVAEENIEEAQAILSRIADTAGIRGPANYLLAEILLTRHRNVVKAEKRVRLALEADPCHSESHRLLAIVHFRKNDISSCAKELRLALALDRYNFAAHSALGNGRVDHIYPHNLISSPLLELRSKQRNYSNLEDVDDAIDDLMQLAEQDSSPQILTDLATIYYYRGNLELAEEFCYKALQQQPGWGLSHFIISLVQQRRIRNNDIVTQSIRKTILAQKTITPPPGLESIFSNFGILTPEQKKLVLISIQPLAKHLEKIKNAEGSYYFLPINHFLWEAERSMVKPGQRTFDGRLWDDVKGVGGKNSVTGVAELEEAIDGGFNVLAHEFAHQIHYMALDDFQKRKITELYQNALERGITLDYYAAANDMEYFAQGYEAYISTIKRPLLKSTACHTRQELLKLDPQLFSFIASLVE